MIVVICGHNNNKILFVCIGNRFVSFSMFIVVFGLFSIFGSLDSDNHCLCISKVENMCLSRNIELVMNTVAIYKHVFIA